ncbi:MAG: Rod shape-determining protein MreD [Deinococcales bacterium]
MQLILFYIFLMALQGFLAVLVEPLPAPDMFLIAALTLLWRLSAWRIVLVAYGIGLLQDLTGHGQLGLHALGLSAGVLVASLVISQISQSGMLERLLVVLAASLGKWFIFLLLILWLAKRDPLGEILRLAPLEIFFTLLISMIILPIADELLERNTFLRKELL